MAIVRVEGLSDLRQALQQMSKDAPKELAKANKQVGQIVAAEAMRRAPKGPHQGGGQITPLSHAIRATQSQTKVTIIAGGAKTPHAGPIEFGGSIPREGFKGQKRYARQLAVHQGSGGRTLTRVPRQPYLFPAVAAKLADVVIAYERAIDALINKLGMG